jgi:hypothetical protein
MKDEEKLVLHTDPDQNDQKTTKKENDKVV